MATGGFRMGHPHPNLTLFIQNNFYPRSIKKNKRERGKYDKFSYPHRLIQFNLKKKGFLFKKNNYIKLNISYKLLYYYIFYKVFYYFHYYTYIKNRKIKNKIN